MWGKGDSECEGGGQGGAGGAQDQLTTQGRPMWCAESVPEPSHSERSKAGAPCIFHEAGTLVGILWAQIAAEGEPMTYFQLAQEGGKKKKTGV